MHDDDNDNDNDHYLEAYTPNLDACRPATTASTATNTDSSAPLFVFAADKAATRPAVFTSGR